MNIHILQHSEFDDNATIQTWADEEEHNTVLTNLIKNEKLPGVEDFDWLIILGGVMDTFEEDKYPWLKDEKKLIKDAIDAGKIVYGICFGAQLIAEVLGGKVYKNEHSEIGWQPVKITKEAKDSDIFGTFPDFFSVFQWHDYTFELPEGAVRIAENDAAINQAFEYKGHVFATQFHPEFNDKTIRQLVAKHGDSIKEGKYIQPKEVILADYCTVREADALVNLLLCNIGDKFASQFNG